LASLPVVCSLRVAWSGGAGAGLTQRPKDAKEGRLIGDAVAEVVVDAAFRALMALGSGLLESARATALARGLRALRLVPFAGACDGEHGGSTIASGGQPAASQVGSAKGRAPRPERCLARRVTPGAPHHRAERGIRSPPELRPGPPRKLP
jgi:hypothetical protein